MITTCPSALKMLLAKSSLNTYDDLNANGVQVNQQTYSSSSTVAFTSDFVKYYFGKVKVLVLADSKWKLFTDSNILDREEKLTQHQKDLNALKQSQLQLAKQEAELRNEYEKVKHKFK